MRRPHPLRALCEILAEIEVGVDAKVSNIQVSVALRECGWLGVSGAGPDEDIRMLAQAWGDALTAKGDADVRLAEYRKLVGSLTGLIGILNEERA